MADIVKYEQKAIAEFSLTPEEVQEQARKFLSITVKEDDAQSYKDARAALTLCVSTRTGADKRRKELTEDARKWSAAVNQAYKDLVAPLAPAEEHLRHELDLEDGRRAEVKARKVAEEKARVDGIRAKIEKIRSTMFTFAGKSAADLMVLHDNMSTIQIDEAYQEFQEEARKVLDEVKLAIVRAYGEAVIREEEAAKQRIEAERLAKQRAEQEAEAARLAAERKAQEEAARKIREAQEAEARRLADEARKIQEAKDRAEFEAKAKERAEAEAREKIEREAREAQAKAEAGAKAKAEREARQTDKEKLVAYAEALAAVPYPKLSSRDADFALNEAHFRLKGLCGYLHTKAEAL